MPDSAVVNMGRGVLRPDLAATRFRLAKHAPSQALASFVEYYWIPRWDLRGEPPFTQTILPHPNVHLVFEASGAGIFGVDRRLFSRSLSGLGLAFGVRFLGWVLPAVLAGADLTAHRPGDPGRAAVRAAGGKDAAGDHARWVSGFWGFWGF